MDWVDKFKDNLLEVLYRVDQPRDKRGRWTAEGSGGSAEEGPSVVPASSVMSKGTKLYRTTGKTGLGADLAGGIHFSRQEGGAVYYAQLYGTSPQISEWEIVSDANVWNELEQGSFGASFPGGRKTSVNTAKEAGWDGVQKVNEEVVIWNLDKVKEVRQYTPEGYGQIR